MSTTPQAPTPAPEQTPETSPAAAPVSDKRKAATGAIPKQMQSWIFITVILVAAVGLFFSSSAKTKPSSTSAAAAGDPVKPLVGGLTPDEVQRRLQESEDIRRNLAAHPHSYHSQDADPDDHDATLSQLNSSSSQTPARDPIEEDERKRDYLGRFASNVALTYRPDSRSSASTPQFAATQSATGGAGDLGNVAAPAPEAPVLPADFQRQLQMLQAQQDRLLLQQRQQLAASGAGPAGSQPLQQQSQAPASPPQSHKNADLNAASGKDHVIFEGTVLESVLINRLNSDFAGPVICQITTDVYSHDHSQLLIPAGTRVLGETRKVSDLGQSRLAVVFHRLIMPDGYAVDLDQAPGLNQIAETALHDKVNHHYFMIFGSSIAVGAIAGLASIGANNSAVTGLPTSNASAYREGVSASCRNLPYRYSIAT